MDEKDRIREILKEEMSKEFSTMDKVKAFGYHVGMVMFGYIICPEKYENYIKVFDEFINMNEEQEKNATE